MAASGGWVGGVSGRVEVDPAPLEEQRPLIEEGATWSCYQRAGLHLHQVDSTGSGISREASRGK